MAKDTWKLTVMECPTYGDWFERFVKAQKRMGDDVRPDRAISTEVLHAVMDDVELDWATADGDMQFKLALEGSCI